MLKEALVTFICMQGDGGCKESLTAYYKSSSEVRQVVKYTEKTVKKHIGEDALLYTTPALAMILKNKANVVLHRDFILVIDPHEQMLLLQWTY